MFDSGGTESYPTAPGELRAEIGAINATPTVTERLYRERAQLQSRLSEVEKAIAAIEASPQTQQVVDSLAKLHWLR